jgi:hypothetical protein
VPVDAGPDTPHPSPGGKEIIMDGATISLLVGGIGAGAVLLMFAMSRKPVKCPACGREQPLRRAPASMEQAMWGGSTCEGCGANLDSRGRLKSKK